MPVLLTAAFNEVSNDKKQLRPLRPASNLASRGKRNAKLADAMTRSRTVRFFKGLKAFQSCLQISLLLFGRSLAQRHFDPSERDVV